MIDKDKLAEAARYADARSEELGLPGWCDAYGLDLEGAAYVAGQRALRAAMILDGQDPKRLSGLHPTAVSLSPEVNKLLPMFAALFMDGLAVGMTVKKED